MTETHPYLEAALNARPQTNEEYEAYVAHVQQHSVEEKKRCSLQYRAHQMFWAGIKTQEEFATQRQKALEDYRSGAFFLERIGRYRSVDAPLTLTLLNLRA